MVLRLKFRNKAIIRPQGSDEAQLVIGCLGCAELVAKPTSRSVFYTSMGRHIALGENDSMRLFRDVAAKLVQGRTSSTATEIWVKDLQKAQI